MIEAKGVGLCYPDGTLALQDIEFQVYPGEMAYITGPSGSGKTSLLKLLMGMEFPSVGSLRVLGQDINRNQAEGIRRLRLNLGPVFQEFRLIRGRTALENIMLGMRFLDFTPGQLKAKAEEALEKVGLAHKALAPVENLSWGESQRVAIARAVVRKPALILADEPTGNLDKDNALRILELLTALRDKDTAVLITTHATHLIEGKTDITLIHMNQGRMSIERPGVRLHEVL